MNSDAIVIAGSIKDRFLSSRWKMFIDRLFVNGHCPVFSGKQFAFIISGSLRKNFTLFQVSQALVSESRSNIAGFVTDEYKEVLFIARVGLPNSLHNRVYSRLY